MTLRLPVLPYRAFRGLLGAMIRLEVTLVGARHLPDRACIACPNHPGREEILLVYRIFRPPVRILYQIGLFDTGRVAEEVRQAVRAQYRVPSLLRGLILHWAMWAGELIVRQIERIGSIPVAREEDSLDPAARMSANRLAIRRSVRALERGEIIAMSPEGRLSPDGGVGTFQQGVAAIAWQMARRDRPVPILPMIFRGLETLPHGVLGRQRVMLALGEPLLTERRAEEPRKAYLERVTGELRERMITLQEQVQTLPPVPPAVRARRYGRGEAPLLPDISSPAR